MFYKLIINYINKLTKEDIIIFSNKNNINLNNNELDYIYNKIKKDYLILLSDNYEIAFNDAKKFINENNLKKIYNLFIDYRNKYLN